MEVDLTGPDCLDSEVPPELAGPDCSDSEVPAEVYRIDYEQMLEDVQAGRGLPSNGDFNQKYLRQLGGRQFPGQAVLTPCPICTDDTGIDDLGILLDSQGRGCGCKACIACVKRWLQTETVTDQLNAGHLSCFLAGQVRLCPQPDANVLDILPGLMHRLVHADGGMDDDERRMLHHFEVVSRRRALEQMLERTGDRLVYCRLCNMQWTVDPQARGKQMCQNPDCTDKRGSPTTFCMSCDMPPNKGYHEGMSCEQYTSQIAARQGRREKEAIVRSGVEVHGSMYPARMCPKCEMVVFKYGGCNLLKCTSCQQQFCCLCGQSTDDNNPYKHYSWGPCWKRVYALVDMRNPPSPPSGWTCGDPLDVVAHSLVKARELNGKHAKVTGSSGERLEVEFDAPYGTKALLPVNLRATLSEGSGVNLGDIASVHSLAKATELNGRWGKIVAFGRERIDVDFGSPYGRKALLPDNLRASAVSEVRSVSEVVF